MSKIYFAKYLPVEGEIKESDGYITVIITNPKIPSFFGQVWRDMFYDGMMMCGQGNKSMFSRDDCKKAKLFLCSRDIQVGDKAQFQLSVHSPWKELECIETYENTVVLKEDEHNIHTTPDTTNQCFKVIGEISPDTTWVKEGDEFDEDEVEITPLYKRQYPDEWNEPVEFKGNKVRIKGPCGHFH